MKDRATTTRSTVRRGCTAGANLLVAGLLAGGAAPLSAQETPPPDDAAPGEHYRIVSFSPRSGPPGTTVRVSASELPSITPVYVTLGGTSSGFEVLGTMLMTDLTGELAETVRIPDWATPEQTHLFVIMDVYFGRLAASAPFHVTAPDGSLVRVGTVEAVDGACVGLRGEDGELYALRGAAPSLSVGERVVVEGTVGDSDCPGGLTIRVARTSPAGASPR